MRLVPRLFAILFTSSLTLYCCLSIRHKHLVEDDILRSQDTNITVRTSVLKKVARPQTLPSDVGTNLTAYIKAKFGNTCYKEESFSQWWANNTLSNELLVDNLIGCRRSISDAFIVGVKKCATTALRDVLAIHPYIMHRPGEIHFYDRHFHEGYYWYRKQFPFSKKWQVVLEKTPQTFSFPEDAPKKMAELNPKTKLVVILCDPVVRAVSDYVHEQYTESYKRFNPPYYRINEQSFELSVFNASGTIDIDNDLVRKGIYSKHLKRWLEYFPKEQIHVVDGNDFSLDPVSEINKIETFLRLPNFLLKTHLDFGPDFFCIAFPGVRCPNMNVKGRQHPDIPEVVLHKLYGFYQPYDIELRHLLNRTFSWMGKDSL
ncbi:heparan sulfate glucosamine 3-O-sulfotransferase 1-like [Saccoglossus kowalevskii]|uniref:Heparan sulfate glucosamine 3-O-sulfotransferase 5-like n=1 Tax=Saccoglossus kowalevskii TaxID=10224 RepID=A0ABM0GQK9_SACKO|nr:PREDICTED: heparan sulfate glucosamine 3-O-sulfotransferase 5-like [Saccoglossus kowalevskii]